MEPGARATPDDHAETNTGEPAIPSWARDGLFYGIDVSRFRDSDGDGIGDIRGLIGSLDYLHELGVTCLWLLPLARSERRDNGYDVMDYVSIDPQFGTVEDFRDLTRQAHDRGMYVMTDLVVHHTSNRHP